jgi:hypothetical protein
LARKSTLITLVALAALTLAAGCGSSTKIPTAIDTAPPAVPTGLTAAYLADGVAMNWAPNTTDADFAGFVVRRTAHGKVTLLVDAPRDITQFTDPAPMLGCLNTYAVSALDLTGNESAVVTVIVDLRGGPTPVEPVEPITPDAVQPEGPGPLPVGHPLDRGEH